MVCTGPANDEKGAKRLMLTHKIQLQINVKDPEELKAIREKLWSWQRITFRAANYIYTHLFLQEQIKEVLYINEGTHAKLCSLAADEDGILTSSKLNSTYRLLSEKFKGDVPMDIIGALNNRLHISYQQNRKFYWTGERSLTNFRRDINLPFNRVSIKRLSLTADGKNFQFNLFGLPLATYLGKGQDKRDLLAGVLSGQTKIMGCFLKLVKAKIFLHVSYIPEPVRHSLDMAVIAEASLSPQQPISVKIGHQTFSIGNQEEFFYRRLAIQEAFKRAQQSVNYNRSENGKKRQRKNLERFDGLEQRYCEQQVHKYSRKLIDICIQQGAGTLLLVNQESKEAVAKEDTLLIRNWSYQSLIDKISYKAANVGILLIKE